MKTTTDFRKLNNLLLTVVHLIKHVEFYYNLFPDHKVSKIVNIFKSGSNAMLQ